MSVPLQPAILSQSFLAIIPLFALMATGAYARRSKTLHNSDGAALTRFAIDIALPALILFTLLTHRFSAGYLFLPVSMWVGEGVAALCAFLVSRAFKMSRHSTGVALLSVFGNTSFIGYPMTTALFPSFLPATVVIDQFGMTIILYVAIAFLAPLYGERSEGEETGLWKILIERMRSPLLIALVIGLILHGVFSAFPGALESVPAKVSLSTLQMVGVATVPVVMISLGMRLSAGAAKKYLLEIAALGVIKLIILPLVCFIVSKFVFHLPPNLVSISVLEGAVAPAATSTVFAVRYRMNSDLSVATFFVLTVASGVTMPLIVSLLR